MLQRDLFPSPCGGCTACQRPYVPTPRTARGDVFVSPLGEASGRQRAIACAYPSNMVARATSPPTNSIVPCDSEGRYHVRHDCCGCGNFSGSEKEPWRGLCLARYCQGACTLCHRKAVFFFFASYILFRKRNDARMRTERSIFIRVLNIKRNRHAGYAEPVKRTVLIAWRDSRL